MYGDHCQLDQVGRRALHRRVDRGTLRTLAARRIARLDLGQIKPAPEDRLDIAEVACSFARTLHVVLYPGVTQEIALHVLLRRAALDTQLRGEPEGRHAVDQSEVDDFRVAAL